MSRVTEQYRHKDEWQREGKGFMVVVSRHTVGEEHRWCVYLYVYEKHPAFVLFKPESSMWDQPHFACHSYVSLFNVHRRPTGVIASFQLGWDYNHDGDYFTEYATADEAASVFWDADQLFKQAEEWSNEQ